MKSKSSLRFLLILVVAVAAYSAQRFGWIEGSPAAPRAAEADHHGSSLLESGSREVAELFRAQRSGVMVELSGVVQRELSDDEDGARHQRFVLDLEDGMTLLVAHNIDLAPRVPLARGDRIELLGQYEWNERGGVIHWTHADPGGSHPGGWIRHAGKTYE